MSLAGWTEDDLRNYIEQYISTGALENAMGSYRGDTVDAQKLVVPNRSIDLSKVKRKVGFSAYLTGSPNVPTGVWTTLAPNVIEYDTTVGAYNPATGVFTVSVTGIWVIRMWVDWNTSAAGMRAIAIWNSAAVGAAGNAWAVNYCLPNGNFDHPHEATRVVRIPQGTTLQAAAFQNSGAGLLTISTSSCPFSQMFSAQLIETD